MSAENKEPSIDPDQNTRSAGDSLRDQQGAQGNSGSIGSDRQSPEQNHGSPGDSNSVGPVSPDGDSVFLKNKQVAAADLDSVKPMAVSRSTAASGADAVKASAGQAENLSTRVRPEANRALSLVAARGFRSKMLRWRRKLDQINALEPGLQRDDDSSLRKASLALRYRAMAGEKLATLLPEAYALVREAGRRSLSMRHYDVQMVGGISLFEGCIAEMQTGEGKTLTATLPLYLHSLLGKGTHLATVNDYLAKRDAEWMMPLFNMLGVSVGIIQTQDDQASRRKSYDAAITYGTAKEFGFDFLRDRLLLRAQNRVETEMLGEGGAGFSDSGDEVVMRGMHFCLVDEADSILIDEARTPLIIGSIEDTVRDQIVETYRWASETADQYHEDEHYEIDPDTKQYELTGRGRQKVRSLPKSDLVRMMGLVDLYEYTERAIKVHHEFHLDRQYVVRPGDQGEDEIVIVDEFTGRLAEGRKWRDGIHQAIESKENLAISVPTGQAARITVQDLFLRYRYLAGMTGTAATSAGELRRIYRTPVIRVPTNRPPQRVRLPDRVFGTTEQKFQAIVQEVQSVIAKDRPVLIGTRSIDKSEMISHLLTELEIPHQVLNANNVAKEAEIVADAGGPQRVTVATNMAGRGTDVKLVSGVEDRGGMHVICTELHDAARIDRQLIGRCGRQGDRGSYRQYLSLDDDILKGGFGPKKAQQLKKLGVSSEGEMNRYARRFKKAQRKVERKHFRDRMILLHHEKERKKMQREIGQDPYLDTPD